MTCDVPRRSRAKPAARDPSKLAKLVRLLGSDKPGEVVAAAAALRRGLEAAGLDFHDLADAVEAGLRPAEPRPPWGPRGPSTDNWESMAWFAHHHRHRLPVQEREFVEDMLLGRGQHYGRVTEWHLRRLREIVRGLKAA